MTSNTYFFDVIITRLEANQEFIEPKCVTVDVLFHKLSMRLTSTHINVESFTNEPVCVFQVALDELKYMVAQVPVVFIVNYKDENIGLCETLWPCEKEENVHSCMDEIFHIGKCDLISEGKQVGVLEYVMRIKRKLDEPEKQLSALQLNSNLQKLLNPCDSSFITPAYDKSMKENINELSNSYENSNETCIISRSSDTIDISKDVTEAERTNNTFEVTDFKHCWCCKENREFTEKMNETRYSGPKVCPICKHNLMWLPKFTPCPNCGFKPVLISISSEKKPLVTEEIIETYAEASTDSETDPLRICSLKEKTPRAKGRCVCGGKGTCAFCRVHSLVDDLIREAKGKDDSVPNEFQCEKDETKLFNVCKTKSHPSFLAKVLSELYMLLDVKQPSKPKRSGISKQCEEMIQSAILKTKVAKRSAQKHRLKNEIKAKPHKTNRKIVPPKEKVKKMVPSHMGYLWTKSQLGKRKPGYIDKDVKRIMHYFLNVHDTLTPEARQLTIEHVAKICKENAVIKPTLKVIKKGHAYFVCLNSNSKYPSKSLTYKIEKYPYLQEYSKMKRLFKAQGFKKCVCHKPVADCICRDYHERKALKNEVIKYCRQRNMPDCQEDFVLSDTSISEVDLEMDVTAPAACVRSAPKKKQKMCLNQGTQYNKSDIVASSALKTAQTAYKFYATYDCAVGRKYGEQVYVPQPGEILPATDWLQFMREKKKAAKAAIEPKPLKPGKIERLKPKPVEVVGPPFDESGPPKIARDGTALDKDDKPLLDSHGNAYKVEKTMDGRLQAKPKKKGLNMMKYLAKKGLIVEKQKGRNAPKLPPGGINPEYLAKERELKRKRYCELLQQPPGILCKVDRLGRSEPCGGWRVHIC